MATFLIVVGAVVSVAFLALVVGFFILKHRLKTALKGVVDLATGVGLDTSPAPPTRIRLQNTTDSVDVAAEELTACGFDRAGSFEVEGIPGMRIGAWVHRERKLFAAAYHSAKEETWIDLAARSSDGLDYVITNSARAGVMDQPPETRLSKHVDATVRELLELASSATAEASLEPVSTDGFTAAFESAYARETDWRNRRGGPTFSEVRRVAEAELPNVDDETVRTVFEFEQIRFQQKIERECYREFVRLGVMPVDAEDETYLLVHERSDAENLLVELELETEVVEEAFDEPRGDVLDWFERGTANLPEEFRPEALGEAQFPLRARVYRLKLEIA